MLGREINLPIDLMVGNPEERPELHCHHEYVVWLQDVMDEAFEYARQSSTQATERQKRNYDRKVKIRRFKVGDWVWYYYPPKAQGKLAKHGWDGPYLVIDCPSDIHYIIQKERGGKTRRVHGDNLKRLETDIEDRPGRGIRDDLVQQAEAEDDESEGEDLVVEVEQLIGNDNDEGNEGINGGTDNDRTSDIVESEQPRLLGRGHRRKWRPARLDT